MSVACFYCPRKRSQKRLSCNLPSPSLSLQPSLSLACRVAIHCRKWFSRVSHARTLADNDDDACCLRLQAHKRWNNSRLSPAIKGQRRRREKRKEGKIGNQENRHMHTLCMQAICVRNTASLVDCRNYSFLSPLQATKKGVSDFAGKRRQVRERAAEIETKISRRNGQESRGSRRERDLQIVCIHDEMRGAKGSCVGSSASFFLSLSLSHTQTHERILQSASSFPSLSLVGLRSLHALAS